jgi:dipicolinate synthase subunit B
MIGYAMCGSFCTLSRSLEVMRSLALSGRDILPIMSPIVYSTDSRFTVADTFREQVRSVSGRDIVHTVEEAEPLGPRTPLEALVIAPCTGNTLAKLAHGVADTPVTMAAKSHLRNGRPVLIAPSTNDALAGAAENIGKLLVRKNIYFVPFGQDDPISKPTSMVADFEKIPQAIEAALAGKQLQPVLIPGGH